MNEEVGPIKTISTVNIASPIEYASFLSQAPIKMLQQNNLYPRYFIKLIGPQR